MAKFKCKNCKHEFDKFCDKLEDSLDVKCPSCGSHWVESVFEEDKKFPNLFPVLPYTDPPYPKPWIGDPFDPTINKYWCRQPRGPIGNLVPMSSNLRRKMNKIYG